ncbi:ScaI family restriction endonuclease [Corynebacterium afermentans]|nr:ScaI family restriction endonuclease [Corynebacterium afermentans]
MNPYEGLEPDEWESRTAQLVLDHPLDMKLVTEVVLESWEDILNTKIAGDLVFGVDYLPSPQMLGNFLHTVIPIRLGKETGEIWREGVGNVEKDLVCLTDDKFSIEIKTSSSNTIYANRSYAQPTSVGKSKDGYYLGINFETFKTSETPMIKRVKFGWLNHSDWIPQKTPTGQQARISAFTWKNKFIDLL